MKNFKTIADGEIFGAAYEVNKSKFFAHVKHVEDEEAARDFLQMIRKKYFDATHNCSAWVLGERGDKQKSNDDGEPGGTAGNPILETIKKERPHELRGCRDAIFRRNKTRRGRLDSRLFAHGGGGHCQFKNRSHDDLPKNFSDARI